MVLLVLSIVPVSAVTAEEVNAHSHEVANFIKEKCHGDCDNVVLLGDDYVVPSFRRKIKWLNWYLFFSTLDIDYILTDIGYIQRESKTFAEFDALFKIKIQNFQPRSLSELIISKYCSSVIYCGS